MRTLKSWFAPGRLFGIGEVLLSPLGLGGLGLGGCLVPVAGLLILGALLPANLNSLTDILNALGLGNLLGT